MRTAISVIALGTLAACGQNGGGNEAAGGNQAAVGSVLGASSAVALLPGEWESQIQAAKASQSSPGVRPATARFCITPEQAANPTAAALAGDKGGADCTMKDYSMAGGRIRGTTVCSSGPGSSVRMTVDGRYTATTYEMTIQSQIDVGGKSHNSEMRVNARRVGDCPAGASDSKSAG